MKRLAILGASGHGKVVAEIAELSGWNEIVFFDDAFPQTSSVETWDVQGNTEKLVSSFNKFDGVIVAIGDNAIRLEKSLLLQKSKANLVSLLHPSAIVSRYAQIDMGTVVMAGVVINPFSKVGLACIVNTGAMIDHDCLLFDGVHISPNAILAGTVKVGKNSWIGLGACVKECTYIGKNVTIGAGAVVLTNMPNDVVAIGIPAKIM